MSSGKNGSKDKTSEQYLQGCEKGKPNIDMTFNGVEKEIGRARSKVGDNRVGRPCPPYFQGWGKKARNSWGEKKDIWLKSAGTVAIIEKKHKLASREFVRGGWAAG